MKAAVAILAGTLILSGRTQPQSSNVAPARPADGRYLIGHGPCVAVEEGWPVRIGTRLLAVSPGRKPAEIAIGEVRAWPGRSPGGPRPSRTDCTFWFQEDVTTDDHKAAVRSLARRVPVLPEDGAAFFVLAPEGGRIIIPGSARAVGRAERQRLFTAVRPSLPASWRSARTLVQARRYGPTDGHEVIELSVGKATRNARGATPPIKQVAIRRFFLVDGRVAGFENFERTSGVEERVETEGPELTDANWAVLDTETTVAFVSDDDGASWERLSTNIGFESVIWEVNALKPGLPVTFRRDLYTHH